MGLLRAIVGFHKLEPGIIWPVVSGSCLWPIQANGGFRHLPLQLLAPPFKRGCAARAAHTLRAVALSLRAALLHPLRAGPCTPLPWHLQPRADIPREHGAGRGSGSPYPPGELEAAGPGLSPVHGAASEACMPCIKPCMMHAVHPALTHAVHQLHRPCIPHAAGSALLCAGPRRLS